MPMWVLVSVLFACFPTVSWSVPSCFFVEGNFNLNSSSNTNIEIGGNATNCTQQDTTNTHYDRLIIGSNLTLGNGTLTIRLTNGFTPSAGDGFQILRWGSLDGTFGSIDTSGAVLPSEIEWDFSSLYVTGGITAVRSAVVPIPLISNWLLGIGLLLIGLWKQRI